MPYQRPMVTVEQNVTLAPIGTDRAQTAFVFGPNFTVHRYERGADNSDVYVGAYAYSQGETSPYPYPELTVDPDKVDAGFTRLYGENVVVQLAELRDVTAPEEPGSASVEGNGGYTKLLFSHNYVDSSSSTGYDGIANPVAKGDSILVGYKVGGEYRSFVTTVTDVDYDASGFDIDSSPSLDTAAGTLVTIMDPIPAEGASRPTNLTASIVDTLAYAEFQRKNELEDDAEAWQWEQGDGNVEGETQRCIIVNGLFLFGKAGNFAGDGWCRVLSADLYATYRELDLSYADAIHSVSGGASAVQALLGEVSPDNPLAMGVYMAALNAATDNGAETPSVFFMATPTDDKNGYEYVLGRAALTSSVYCLAPATSNKEVIELVKNHAEKLSSQTEKLWRIGVASEEVPSSEDILSKATNPMPGDHDYYAIAVKIGTSSDYNGLRVTKSGDDDAPDSDAKLRTLVREGDYVRFNFSTANKWNEETFDVYKVTSVVNNSTVEVKPVGASPRLTATQSPKKVEIYHEYTASELATREAAISSQLADRRVCNVFPWKFVRGGEVMGGEFAACAVAGLVSATEPQQPITNVDIAGIDGVPLAYQTFNKDQLDEMAAGGTFIVTQDLPGGRVYVRHQITTAFPDGNLNTAELSVTRNLDSISYAFDDMLEPYIGKYTVVPGLISILWSECTKLLDDLGNSFNAYGPQLIREETSIEYIRRNAVYKDRIDIGVSLSLPYPCNNIHIVLTV